MKRTLSIILALAMSLSLTACGGAATSTSTSTSAAPTASGESPAASGESPAKEKLVAGVCWYNYADTFIANARSVLEKAAEADGLITIQAADSQNDIAMQTNNVNNLYTKGVDYMVINNINTNAKAELINQAKEKGATIIFANTDSPSEEEFALYEKVYHVSSAAEQSGVIMGEQVAEYWKANPAADRNGNGKLDYIMLLGVQQHYDTQVRAKFSVETVQKAGIETNLVQEAVCNYQRAEAQNQVASILQARKGDVEAIFACNDDMALGAIEALKAVGFYGEGKEIIPVVGVDATAVGVEALKDGTLLGTALNNPVTLGNATYRVMKLLAEGKEITQESIGIEGTRVEGHHVYIDYVSITADNTEDAAH